MQEVREVPPWYFAVQLGFADVFGVSLAEELHPHDGEDEDDDDEHHDEVG